MRLEICQVDKTKQKSESWWSVNPHKGTWLCHLILCYRIKTAVLNSLLTQQTQEHNKQPWSVMSLHALLDNDLVLKRFEFRGLKRG